MSTVRFPASGPLGTRARQAGVENPVALLWRFWRYNGFMATIQVKNVSAEAHAVLRQRAAASGQSLQEYMLAWIERSTARPTLDEVLDRIGHRSGGRMPADDVVRQLREERDHR
jgi:hypothetical protein